MSLKKYYRSILASVASILFIGYYFFVFSTAYESPIQEFQQKFVKTEKALELFLEQQASKLKSHPNLKLWDEHQKRQDLSLHIYRNDSLIYWNTNQIPVLRFSEIHFPSDGILHLQNGWYYAKTKKIGTTTLCASFLIKQDYSFENSELKNVFPPLFRLPFPALVSLDSEIGYPIVDQNNHYLFSILPKNNHQVNRLDSVLLLGLCLLTISLWFVVLFHRMLFMKQGLKFSIPILVLGIRILSIKYMWFHFLNETEAYRPNLYGTSEWFPNLLEYLINCCVIVFVVLSIQLIIKTSKTKKQSINFLVTYLFSFFLWWLIIYLNQGLIENSSIPFIIDKLFSLNVYTVIALISIGVLFYVYHFYTRKVLFELQKLIETNKKKWIVIGFTNLLFVITIFLFTELPWIIAFVPFLVQYIILSTNSKKEKQHLLIYGLIYLVLFALLSTILIGEFNRRKERSERELFANQLATEKDIVTEVEYTKIKDKIKQDDFLTRFIHHPRFISISEFENTIERRIFNGFWERYEMNFDLFSKEGFSFIHTQNNKTSDFEHINHILEEHGTYSEIDSNIFFVNDYTGKYSYIIKQKLITESGDSIYFVGTLKSKKIPEEIGFPSLLISEKAKVFEHLTNYSFAKYYRSHLITRYGQFNYPSSDQALNNWKTLQTGYYDKDDYNHFALRKSAKDIIILSKKKPTTLEFITTFSYLFSFFGLLLILSMLKNNTVFSFPFALTLAMKIQVVLIGLVFLSLLAFGWGSGIFVRNQYNALTNDEISEKLKSVETELRGKLGAKSKLTINKDGNNLGVLLQKFTKVFVTDINIYDKEGFLIAASRPRIFNIGLLSEQMNADAFFQVESKDKSEYIHQENIGKLNYSSAYAPFYNNEGQLLAYLNLQHFGQQKEFENQIQQFLVAIINVFMLLLAISIVVAIFVSSWVTSPLRLLQENFANIKFGKHNQPISYNKKDEIGALVKDYNLKLEELEYTAQQLAQSERESAWREMAKQVAHEIKNPLTPMKLSIQHLQRIYDPNDPNSGVKLNKVANSIIEQIDALTKIANEFSNFAKMPRPNEALLDLLPLLENVLEVFKVNQKIDILVHKEIKTAFAMADKDLLLRVFNNLIKNAIQSIPEEKKGEINVYIKENENYYIFQIKDNGVGIAEDQKQKIFVPYFTTKSTGTGIGLAMVKQIVETHQGSIKFESIIGQGTTFEFRIPKAVK
jgi:two-component system, NtrC family, nitrogen regulation sensor histidine kinase NtrY